MTVTIWHNPRCSKSRAALALLQERGIDAQVRLYLDDAPSESEIRSALALLNIPALALVRRGETRFREAGLTGDSSEDDLVAAMAAHPFLIERPVVFANGQAALGRPPEAALDIL